MSRSTPCGPARNSVPSPREWARHAVLPCLSIEAAAFKSLFFSAGCHVRANHQTGSRPALALIARWNLMRHTLAVRACEVVSEMSRFRRGCVRDRRANHGRRAATGPTKSGRKGDGSLTTPVSPANTLGTSKSRRHKCPMRSSPRPPSLASTRSASRDRHATVQLAELPASFGWVMAIRPTTLTNIQQVQTR